MKGNMLQRGLMMNWNRMKKERRRWVVVGSSNSTFRFYKQLVH